MPAYLPRHEYTVYELRGMLNAARYRVSDIHQRLARFNGLSSRYILEQELADAQAEVETIKQEIDYMNNH